MGPLAPLGPVVPGRAGDVSPVSSRGWASGSGSAGGGASWVPVYRWGLGMPGIGLADLLRRWGHLGSPCTAWGRVPAGGWESPQSPSRRRGLGDDGKSKGPGFPAPGGGSITLARPPHELWMAGRCRRMLRYAT